MASRKFFVGGNWKMNGSKALASDLVSKLNAFTHVSSNVDIVVAPPALYLSQVRQELNPSIGVAAQNCYFQAQGAFTGELSPVMLKDVGVDYVILGHSERRTLFNETSELVAQKASFALQHHLGVIACIGETAIERSQNQTWEVLRTQLTSLLVIQDWSKVVIAYEPVWAIGTGQVATPEQAQEAHVFIRQWLQDHAPGNVYQQCRIIYGGSVTAKNCDDLAKQPDIDGFLVGGASLKPEFLDICAAKKSS